MGCSVCYHIILIINPKQQTVLATKKKILTTMKNINLIPAKLAQIQLTLNLIVEAKYNSLSRPVVSNSFKHPSAPAAQCVTHAAHVTSNRARTLALLPGGNKVLGWIKHGGKPDPACEPCV